MTSLQSALDKIAADLAWRGPNGRELKHIVLTREQADALLWGDPLPRWRHKERGTTYTEIGRGKLQDGDPSGLSNGQAMVLYRSDADGLLWCRAVDEFEDGRFERVDDPNAVCADHDSAGAEFIARRADRFASAEGLE